MYPLKRYPALGGEGCSFFTVAQVSSKPGKEILSFLSCFDFSKLLAADLFFLLSEF